DSMVNSIRRISLTQWIIISMIVGVLLGWLAPGFAVAIKPLSTIFLKMIKSLIAPPLFPPLVGGAAGTGDDMKKGGKLAFRAIVYFEIVTTLALAVGLIAVNVVKPGAGVDLGAAGATTSVPLATTRASFAALVEHGVPQSIFDAAAHNDALQVTFFSV